MLINRKNYESFFLLYADDELCAAEKILVEDFVAENADLIKEFEMLQAAILPAEAISFSDKSALYRNEVLHADMQENLFLFMDMELSDIERQKVEFLVKTDPLAKNEYEALLQTKLNARDRIIFPDKHLLYKKEKENPVFRPFLWWAAAAVLLGFGLFFGITVFKRENNADIAGNIIYTGPFKNPDAPVSKPAVNETAKINTKTSEKPTPFNDSNTTTENTIATEQKGKIKSKSYQKTIDKQKIIQDTQEDQPLAVFKKQEIFEKPESIIIEKATPPVATLILPEKKSILEKMEDDAALEASYKDALSYAVTRVKNENKILYMDEDVVKRSKPFGILRKVKKFVERTAHIKPGNTLRIAGIEFKGG